MKLPCKQISKEKNKFTGTYMQLRNFYLYMDATMAVYARRLYGFCKTNLTQAGKAS